MATKIVTKNSSTASAVPTASDLVQGELAVNVADKRLFTEDNAGAIVELGTNPSGNVTFQDNGKAIFGAGSDLQIYHDGTNSYVDEVGTGTLYVRADSATTIANPSNTLSARFRPSTSVSLYYNGSEKLATTSTGIDVTGTATMDYLTVGNAGSDYALKIKEGSGDEYYQLGVDSYGGLVFYNETTKVAEFTDASTFVTQGDITVNGTATMDGLVVEPTSATGLTYAADGTNSYINFEANSISDSVQLYAGQSSGGYFSIGTKNSGGTLAERMRIDSAGNVGIGESSPAQKIHLRTSGVNTGARLQVAGGSGRAYDILSTTDGSLTITDANASSERLRIDSSGNLLVGKTSADNTTAGTRIHPLGYASFTIANDYPIIANRLSSDGDIAVFRKDGADVGSIGTTSTFTYLVGQNSGVAVGGSTAALIPVSYTPLTLPTNHPV